MKKLILIAMSIALCTSACGKKTDETPKADEAAAAQDEAKPDTANANAGILAGLENKTSAGLDALKKGKSDQEMKDIDRAVASSDDAEIRILAYSTITRNFESDTDDLKFYLGQLKNEKDANILAKGLRSLMNNLSVSTDVYDFYKQNAKHENAEVRKAAMSGLINSNNKAAEGIEAEAMKFLDDSDAAIKKDACKELLRANNSLAMPKVEELMKNADTDPQLLGGCAEGLLTQWYNGPFFDKFDAKAYTLTLDYLKKTPRSKDQPAWVVLSSLKSAPKAAWNDLSKDAYKAADVAAVLTDIAKDTTASTLAREYAIEAIAVHGTKADLEALKTALGDDPAAKKIDKAIAKAK